MENMKRVINLTDAIIHIVSDDSMIIATYPKEYKEVIVVESKELINIQIGDQSIPVMVKKYDLKRIPQNYSGIGHFEIGGGSYSTSNVSPSIYGWPEEKSGVIYIVSPHIWEYIPKGRNDFFVPGAPITKSKIRDIKYGLRNNIEEFRSTFNEYVIRQEAQRKYDNYNEIEIIGYRMLVQGSL